MSPTPLQPNFIADFDLAIWREIETYLVNTHFNDSGLFNCGEGMFWNINYVRAACIRTPTFTQENGLQVSYKFSCGSQCCERHTRICRNEDGTLNLTTYDATNPWSIDCDGPDILMDSDLWLGKVEFMDNCRVRCPAE